jgi:hypothetical protein
MPSGVYFEQHPELTGKPMGRRSARLLWGSADVALVELRERFRGFGISNSEEWECYTVLVGSIGFYKISSTYTTESYAYQSPIVGPEWVIMRRGPTWTCGERNPYGGN